MSILTRLFGNPHKDRNCGDCLWWDRSSMSLSFHSGVHLPVGFCDHDCCNYGGDLTISCHPACVLFCERGEGL